jgi:hypothetical protein
MTDQTPAPAPADTTQVDPIAALTAELAALRSEITALKDFKPAPAPVPVTDRGKPTVTPRTPDFSTLPPIARMASGYSQK